MPYIAAGGISMANRSVRTLSRIGVAIWAALVCAVHLPALAQNQPAEQTPPVKTELLPEVAPGDAKLSTYTPARPYVQVHPGLLERSLFKTQGSANVEVEVLDILVPKSDKPVALDLAGSAVVQVRVGRGVLHDRGKSSEIEAGATFTLAPGTDVATIENTSAAPVVLRAYQFTGR
jgi:hypothetical protein